MIIGIEEEVPDPKPHLGRSLHHSLYRRCEVGNTVVAILPTRGSSAVTIRAHDLTLGDLSRDPRPFHEHHRRDVALLVAQVIEPKHHDVPLIAIDARMSA